MTYIEQDKETDILKAYEAAITAFGRNARFASRKDLIDTAITYGAPRFYVSFEVARRIISIMNRGGKPYFANKYKRLMYTEIFKRFKELTNRKGSYKALQEILKSPAPSFFIDRYQFARIIYRQIKKEVC